MLWFLSGLSQEFPAYTIEELEDHPDIMKLVAMMEMRNYAKAHAQLDQQDGAKHVSSGMLELLMRVKKQNAREDVRKGKHR